MAAGVRHRRRAPRSSSVVSTLNEADPTQGDFTLGPVSLQVDAGDRIGITGPNGAGKSTLLRLLLGRATPDTGSASLGASVAMGGSTRPAPARRRLPLADAFEAPSREYAGARCGRSSRSSG